jgi:hypothetical protein
MIEEIQTETEPMIIDLDKLLQEMLENGSCILM